MAKRKNKINWKRVKILFDHWYDAASWRGADWKEQWKKIKELVNEEVDGQEENK